MLISVKFLILPAYTIYEDGTDSVLNCQHIWRQGITQKKEYINKVVFVVNRHYFVVRFVSWVSFTLVDIVVTPGYF